MADNAIYIEDGYTATKKIELSPRLTVTVDYRPALYETRLQHHKRASVSPEAAMKAAYDLIQKHVIEINGEKLIDNCVGKLRPELVSQLINLILGYEPEDELRDQKN